MALWFLKSFEPQLDSLNVKEMGTGIVHNLEVSHETEGNSQGSKYNNLPEEEQEKIEQILLLLTLTSSV